MGREAVDCQASRVVKQALIPMPLASGERRLQMTAPRRVRNRVFYIEAIKKRNGWIIPISQIMCGAN